MVPGALKSSKNSNKYLEEAQASGVLHISNKVLRDINQLGSDEFDLMDVQDADLSLNSLQHVPPYMSDWFSLNKLSLTRNGIREIPNFFVNFSLLHTLDMSSNSLSEIPSFICYLSNLVILRFRGNSILSLPPELGKLNKCQELDVSGNQLKIIPSELGNMKSLFYLDISRNQLEQLPNSISKLNLIHFDASTNKICMVPLCYQQISTLKYFDVSENPLKIPSLHVLKYGRIHFFKALEAEISKLHHVPESNFQERSLVKNNSFDTVIDVYNTLPADNTLKAELETNVIAKSEKTNSNETDLETNTLNKAEKIESKEQLDETEVVPRNLQYPKASTPKKVDKSSTKISPNLKSGTSGKTLQTSSKLPKKDTLTRQNSSLQKKTYLSKSTLKKSSVTSKPTKVPTTQANSKSLTKSISSAKTSLPKRSVPLKTTSPQKLSKTIPKSKIATKPPMQKTQTKLSKKKTPTKSFPGYNTTNTSSNKAISSQSTLKRPTKRNEELNYTMRRKNDKYLEEIEMMENIRDKVEKTLNSRLESELQKNFCDGVLLCKLANLIKPRSVTNIAAPSPAVPKLNPVRSRKNVENFISACPHIGIKSKDLCPASDILKDKEPSLKFLKMMTCLVSLLPENKTISSNSSSKLSEPTVKVISSFLHPTK